MAEVFDVGNGVPANFDDGTLTLQLTINGSKKPSFKSLPNETIGAFLKRAAQTYSVRTFSAYADGRKLDTSDASKALASSGFKEVEIVAKDARG